MRYIIQKGDTLSDLAKRFNTTVKALADANSIKDPNKIYAGQAMTVPGPATGAAGLDMWGVVKRFLTWPGR